MNFLLIVLLTAIAQVFLPWWVIAAIPFIIQLGLPKSSAAAFWGSFTAVGLVWGSYAFYLHYISNGAMSDRIAQIFFLPNGWAIMAVTILAGGLVAGFSGLSGYLLRKVFKKKPAVPESV